MAQAEVEPGGLAVCPRFAETQRRDAWWAGPMATAIGLGIFIVYATFRAFYNGHFDVGHGSHSGILPEHAHLLSPFYSPLIILPFLPSWVSPALLILWAPGGFRLTCYYYRKAYYRAFFMDPPACAVGEPSRFCGFDRGKKYEGETRLWLFQNLHRYFMYIALIFLVILAYDVVKASIWPTEAGGFRLGVSVGTLVLAANVTLLSLYTFSCHSLRHVIGGRLDSFSRTESERFRYKLWKCVSNLNKYHMQFAWTSLFMVGFADFYVWMVALQVFPDIRIL